MQQIPKFTCLKTKKRISTWSSNT